MKPLARLLAALALTVVPHQLWAQSQGEVGSYPNATTLTGNERILADQSLTYPCTNCTVNLTPAQISTYLLGSGDFFPAYSTGFLFWNGSALQWQPVSGSGTVTSVGLSMPIGFSVSPSTITSSGTFSVTTSLSGPLKGSSGAFTTATAADIYGLWSGTCSASTYLRGDGSCQPSGSVGTTGSPASGNLSVFSGTSTITSGNLSGDCTTSGTLAITCTKTGGTLFAPSATTNTTDASNIAAGTLAAGRMPLGITAVPAAGQVLIGNSGGTAYAANTLSGDCTLTSAGSITCLKVNGVAFATSATTDTTNAGNILSGTLGAARMPLGITATPAAGQILIGNTGGTAYAANTLSGDCAMTSMGVITCLKVNGVTFAPSATTDTTNASNITSGTLGAARLPLGLGASSPAAGQLLIGNAGGTAFAVNTMSGDCAVTSLGAITCTKTNGAAFATSATTDATNAGNISSGTLAVARGGTGVGTITGPVKGNGASAFTSAAAADIYGLWSGSCSATTFLRGDGSCQTPSGAGNVSNSGTPVNGQFAEWTSSTTIAGETMGGDCTLLLATITCTKTSGTAFATSATTDATNASNIASGTLAAARMPAFTGDCTTSAGTVATTCTKTNGTSFGTFATQSYATPPPIGGSTPAAGAFTTLTAAAPVNQHGLVVTGGTNTVNSYAEQINSGTATGFSSGLAIAAGTNSSDAALIVRNAANSVTYAEIFGDGGVILGAPTGGDQGVGTINATGIYINGVAVGGNVSTSGSPVTGNLPVFSGTNTITNGNLSGDCTTSSSLAITCTKTSGTAFGTFATANAASPPAIGGTTPAAVTATALTATPTTAVSALVLNGQPSAVTPVAKINGSTTTGQSSGLNIVAGSNANDYSLKLTAAVGGYAIGQFLGNGAWNLGWSTGQASPFWIMQASANGNVTVNAPGTGGAALTVDGNSTTGSSLGLLTNAGTNSSDYSFLAKSQGGTTLFEVFGDGGGVVGAPTGGDKGVGTINATGLYVNGVAVSTGGVSSSTGTFTGTLTGMTTTVTATFKYRLVGSLVTLWVQSGTPNGTSNSTTLTLTGLPSAIQPAPVGGVTVVTNQVYNNGLAIYCGAEIIGDTITFAPSAVSSGYVTNTGAFTASGSKGVSTVFQISYDLEN